LRIEATQRRNLFLPEPLSLIAVFSGGILVVLFLHFNKLHSVVAWKFSSMALLYRLFSPNTIPKLPEIRTAAKEPSNAGLAPAGTKVGSKQTKGKHRAIGTEPREVAYLWHADGLLLNFSTDR
jgi:hypothetical protein